MTDQFVGPYRIVTAFDTGGGGQCQWAFAEKDGKPFFIKRFLSPKYPTDDSPGSKKTVSAKRAKCEAFERHHRALMRLLSDASGPGSNLVVATDFFRDKTTYYKVTERVDVSSLTMEDVARLPFEERITIMVSVSSSVARLHRNSIVHADLKPDNILIQRDMAGKLVGRLIDFDNSFVAGKPPDEPDEVVGDMAYYSPELGGYIQGIPGSTGDRITVASDVFALGLVFTKYATGRLPSWDAKYNYAYQAAAEGASICVPDSVNPSLKALLAQMVSRDPASRPSINTVFTNLKRIRIGKVVSDSGGAAAASSPTGRLTVSKSVSLKPPCGSATASTEIPHPKLKLPKGYATESKPPAESSTSRSEPKPTLRIKFKKSSDK